MSADADSVRGQTRPYTRMNARHQEVEGDHGKSRQDVLDEGLASCANPGGRRAVDAVKKFRGRDRSERDLCLRVIRDHIVPIEMTALGGNQDARIDQRRHGDFGDFGWRLVMTASVSQYRGSGFGPPRRNVTSSPSVHLGGAAGVSRPTGSPPLSMRNVSPR